MALIECYECEKEISDKAPACPHCGAPAGGRRTGVYKTYYKNGQLKDEYTYKDGIKHGPFQSRFENGEMSYRGTYKDGEHHGRILYYDRDDGQLRSDHHRKDGVSHGPSVVYHENGQLCTKCTYKDGEYHGLYEWYDEQGQLGEKGRFNMSEKCGEWIEEGETVTYDPCPPGLEDDS